MISSNDPPPFTQARTAATSAAVTASLALAITSTVAPRKDSAVNAFAEPFTTYPSLVFGDPAEIPASYYADLATRTAKPIAFTEIGWHSDAAIAGWESSEVEQAAFVDRYFTLIDALRDRIEMTVWTFVYDLPAPQPFASMGLRRSDGTARSAWDAWLATD